MIEKTVQYSTTVSKLSEAWAFIFDHVEDMGERPKIVIEPVIEYDEDDEEEEKLQVTVAWLVKLDVDVKTKTE